MVSRPFHQILHQDTEFGALAAQLERYRALQGLWQKGIPEEWRQGTEALSFEDGTLNVGVFHPALALRLRQMEPSLVKTLAPKMPGITQIRFKTLMPKGIPNPRQPEATESLSSANVEAFAKLADELEPSPLKQALKRLVGSRQKS
jgi:hypothetical protein